MEIFHWDEEADRTLAMPPLAGQILEYLIVKLILLD
jgi:hypothetical protein